MACGFWTFSAGASDAAYIYDISVTGDFTGSGQISFATRSGLEQPTTIVNLLTLSFTVFTPDSPDG
jgi:hypothetical protein